jgi:1,4-dihydroxy-2-naphthoyl-CoA synthase
MQPFLTQHTIRQFHTLIMADSAKPKRPTGTVHCSIANQVATITLDNERRANALSGEMCSALLKALDDLERNDEVHVVVLTGKGELPKSHKNIT